MSHAQIQFKDAEHSKGSDLFNLVFAKDHLTKLLANYAVISYIKCHESEILEQFELVKNTVSMEESLLQQAETSPVDLSEASDP